MKKYRLPVNTECDKIDEIREVIKNPCQEVKIKKGQKQGDFTQKS